MKKKILLSLLIISAQTGILDAATRDVEPPTTKAHEIANLVESIAKLKLKINALKVILKKITAKPKARSRVKATRASALDLFADIPRAKPKPLADIRPLPTPPVRASLEHPTLSRAVAPRGRRRRPASRKQIDFSGRETKWYKTQKAATGLETPATPMALNGAMYESVYASLGFKPRGEEPPATTTTTTTVAARKVVLTPENYWLLGLSPYSSLMAKLIKTHDKAKAKEKAPMAPTASRHDERRELARARRELREERERDLD